MDKLIQALAQLLSNTFGERTYSDASGKFMPVANAQIPPVPSTPPSPMAIQTPIPQPSVQQPVQTQPVNGDVETMRKMINVYGSHPGATLSQYADQLAQAVQKYPFWKNNPELLALVPHFETSSGVESQITRPNNLTNWGISVPGNNEAFSKMTRAQVLDRFISGVAERDSNYAKFRTGKPLTDQELLEFGDKYSNKSYGDNIVKGRNFIRQQLSAGQ